MPETPDSLSDRPSGLDSSLDVVGEVLGAVHLTTAVFGRLELGAPWRLRVPAHGYLSFYVVARGSAWIEVGDEGPGSGDRERRSVALSAGDAVPLPPGGAARRRRWWPATSPSAAPRRAIRFSLPCPRWCPCPPAPRRPTRSWPGWC